MENAIGVIIPIGGAEDKGINYTKGKARFDFFEEGILRQVITVIGSLGEPRIELITAASSFPDEMEKTYFSAFNQLGCNKIGHLYITTREQADSEECLLRAASCNCVIFTGGDQLKLSSLLGGTKLMALLKQRYINEPFVIAGTSAGAMAMSGTMIYDGSASKAHLKGVVKFSAGFGFLPNIIIDTHFEKRGRFNRLAQAVAVQPGILGIGLAEDTAMIITGGNFIKVIGSGIVTIVNGKAISHTNLADIDDYMAISIEHLVVHILSNGDIYNLSTQQVQKQAL